MKWPSLDESVSLCICLLTVACNRKISLCFFLAIGCGGKDFGLGRVRALNLTVYLGSGRVRQSRVRVGFGLKFKARADLYSDHISVMLIPVYRPLLKLVQKQITVWPDNATSALQDCFQDTDWNMFKEVVTYNNHTDLQE